MIDSWKIRLAALAEETGFHLYSAALLEGDRAERMVHLPANRCNNSYSVAKAYTMTAIGMLWDQGQLDLEASLCGLLGVAPGNPAWERVTVHHALTHQMGLSGDFRLDIDAEDVAAYGTQDYLSLVLRQPLPFSPGSRAIYSDAAFYLLSRVVTALSGEKLDDFLMKRLFAPLGFVEMAWSKCPLGYPMGATGLYVSSADLAKLGRIYLDGGTYEGLRIVSSAWVKTVLERGYELHPCGAESFGKGGMFGQMLALCPRRGRALAWHAYEPDDPRSQVFFDRAIREVLEGE